MGKDELIQKAKLKKFLYFCIGIASLVGLVIIFLYQRVDIAGYLWPDFDVLTRFLINRSIRFFANDIFALGIIFALFKERKYIVFALWVQLVGIVLFLVPYFALKIYFPLYNGPLISFLHRLMLNPVLLLLLVPAFYYQRLHRPHSDSEQK